MKVKVTIYSGVFGKKKREEYVVSTGRIGMIVKTIKGADDNVKHTKQR